MTPICFYHRADFDGVCSAAIVKKFVPDCELYGIDYGDPFPWDKVMDGPQVSAAELEAGSGLPRRRVYMVDFSLKPDEMKRLNECCDLAWIDHHKSAIEACKAVLPADLPGLRLSSKAACELVWGWFEENHCADDAVHPFVPDFHVPRRFCTCNLPEAVHLLGRYDVWDAENPDWPRIEAFQFGMRTYDLMNPADIRWRVFLDLSSEVEPGYVQEAIDSGTAILDYRDQEAKSQCADGAHVEFLFPRYGCPKKNETATGFDAWNLICLNSLSRGSWQFNSVWDPEKHDAMCVYGQLKDGRWRVSLYSTKEEVDCGAICKALGGGGHKGAAGFICDILPWNKEMRK